MPLTSDENVVALQIPMYDRRLSRVKKHETFQDLTTPALQNFGVDLLKSSKIRLQGARRHQLGYEYQDFALIGRGVFPTVEKSNNVRMLKPLQHFGLQHRRTTSIISALLCSALLCHALLGQLDTLCLANSKKR